MVKILLKQAYFFLKSWQKDATKFILTDNVNN